MKLTIIFLIIFGLLIISECSIKKTFRKKKYDFKSLKPSNYLKRPVCNEIVKLLNDESLFANEYYGDIELLMKIFKDYDDIYFLFRFISTYGSDNYHNEKYLLNYDKEVTFHLSAFPKELISGLNHCEKVYDEYLELEKDITELPINQCLGLSDDDLRKHLEQVLKTDKYIINYMKENIYKFVQNKNLDYCQAINSYTEQKLLLGYKAVNCLLTTDMRNHIHSTQYIKDLEYVIKITASGLDGECTKLTTPNNGTILYRGQTFLKPVKQGDVFVNLGFLSTSSSFQVAKNFANQSNEAVLFIFKNTNFDKENRARIRGKDISEYSSFKGEAEILLSPKQCFRTLSVNIIEKMRHIEIEAIDCDQVDSAKHKF